MNKLFQGALISYLLFNFPLVYAELSSEETTTLRTNLKQHFPDLSIDNITQSPIEGLYQVTAGAAILYVSKEGSYAILGDMIDLQNNQTNLTENERKRARLNALKSLSDVNMVIFSPKDPKYTITVFTDVDCGYCRKLQTEMADINAKGIAVRYLAFPRSGPNSATFDKMVKIWCAKDKKKALEDASKDKTVESHICPSDNVMKEFQLGLMVGVNGTPTIVFEDGTLFPGYLPPDKLLEAVKQIREQSKKT